MSASHLRVVAEQPARVLPEAVAKLIPTKGLAVVGKLAKELACANDVGLEEGELFSLGQAKLHEVAPEWTEARGVRFTTYIYPFIRGAMKDEIRRRRRVSRTHRAMQQEVARVQRQFAATQSDEFDILHNTSEATIAQLDNDLSALAGKLVGTVAAAAEESLRRGTDEERAEAMDHARFVETIHEAVSHMKPPLQQLWQQHYQEGIGLEEYAGALGISLATAKNYHKRFRDRLEKILTAKGYG